MFERLCGVYQVEHQMKVSRVDKVFLHPNQSHQVVLSYQNPENHIGHFARISDDSLGDAVASGRGEGEAADGREEVGGVGVHAGGERGEQPLRAGQHAAQVVITALLEYPC